MTDKTLRLNILHIHSNFGKEGYRVSAEFLGLSKVELKLGEELGNKIIHLCLDEIVAAIQSAASLTAEELLRGPDVAAKELEHKSKGESP